MENILLKCGCSAMALKKVKGGSDIPWCIIHDCGDQAEKPDLTGRKARCSYYGKPVKRGMYNSNCCDICAKVDVCHCERDSSYDLWFFRYKPNKEYDEFYCACHGAD